MAHIFRVIRRTTAVTLLAFILLLSAGCESRQITMGKVGWSCTGKSCDRPGQAPPARIAADSADTFAPRIAAK